MERDETGVKPECDCSFINKNIFVYFYHFLILLNKYVSETPLAYTDWMFPRGLLRESFKWSIYNMQESTTVITK